MLTAIVLSLLAASASADTIVLTDGRTYTGRAVRRGNVVRIEMDHATIEVPADEVEYIIPSKPDEDTASEPEPDTSPEATARRTTGPTAIDATRPEPMLFILMRRLAETPAGSESYNLRQQIRRFRIMAHERKRKVSGQWVGPDYFIRARQAFADTLDEANELNHAAERVRGDTPADDAERRRLRQQAATRYRAASRQWPDPLLRKFLTGIAELYAGDYRRAELLFADCIAEAPQIAGFHQGRCLALGESRRYGDALIAAMDTLRLRPESPHALALVVDAMANIPGAQTDKPPFTDARDLLGEYEDVEATVERARRRPRWLMPGLRRDWNVRDETTMPALPYDRLFVRQAVGVAVGEQFLLVDAEVVEGAEEVFVQAPDGRLFGGEVARKSTFGRQGPMPPLRVLGVADATFTPLEVAQSPEEGADLAARACGTFTQMGSEIREFSTRIGTDGEALKPGNGLLAGESAGPVLTADGKLAGLIAAKTDPAEDDGGDNRVIGPHEIRDLLDASRMRISRGGFGFGHDQAKRLGEPEAVDGQTFLVFGIFAETFE